MKRNKPQYTWIPLIYDVLVFLCVNKDNIFIISFTYIYGWWHSSCLVTYVVGIHLHTFYSDLYCRTSSLQLLETSCSRYLVTRHHQDFDILRSETYQTREYLVLHTLAMWLSNVFELLIIVGVWTGGLKYVSAPPQHLDNSAT